MEVKNTSKIRFDNLIEQERAGLLRNGKRNCEYWTGKQWIRCSGGSFYPVGIYRAAQKSGSKSCQDKSDKSGTNTVLFNGPATIVKWHDGTKTVVKATEGDTFNPAFGFLMAFFLKRTGLSRRKASKILDSVRSAYALSEHKAREEQEKIDLIDEPRRECEIIAPEGFEVVDYKVRKGSRYPCHCTVMYFSSTMNVWAESHGASGWDVESMSFAIPSGINLETI